ncbi:MAG TPA: diacylglycerol kinase family protein, partial [Phycisphaerae bacterium]
VDLRFTTARGAAESIARDAIDSRPADRTLCLVPCGGDGTIQEVVNAMLVPGATASDRVILGVAPGGRCNDFASAFGIRPDARQIAEVLRAGHTEQIDVGRVNERCFCTVAALGFDAAVARFVNQMKMPLVGTPAYVYGVLRVLFRYDAVPMRLTLGTPRGNERVIDGPVFLAATANTESYGGKMRIAPGASPRDGQLDLCLVSEISRGRVLRLLHRVLKGRHTELPEIEMIRTPSLRIESATPQEIWADGEFHATTPATIEVLPGALRMLVPRQDSEELRI